MILTNEELALVRKLRKWPSVRVYVQAMCNKLDAHEKTKGGREGWVDDSPLELMDRVRDEVTELQGSIDLGLTDILQEAADVGNMAMMAADAAGAIKL